MYSKLFTEQEKILNCFDSQIDSSQTVDTLNVILHMSNIHGRDKFSAQNHYEKMPFLYGYKEILQPFFQSSLVKQHSSKISQLGLVEDIK